MLAAGFILISVSVYFDYAGHHSNSHIYILPWVMFAAWVGSVSSISHSISSHQIPAFPKSFLIKVIKVEKTLMSFVSARILLLHHYALH